MNHHSNEWLNSVTSELDKEGIAYSIRSGAKHILVDYEVDGVKKFTAVGRSGRISWRHTRNARAEVRKNLKEMRSEDSSGEMNMSDLPKITHENFEVVNGKPRMRDLDIAAALGFSRPDNIRNLIKSNMEEIRTYGEIAVSEKIKEERGGRPSQVFLLNHDQTILISIMSRTAQAASVRRQVIKAYSDWKAINKKPTQEKPVQEVPTQPEPEVLMNEQAIKAITDSVCQNMGTITLQPQDSARTESQDNFIKKLTELFEWQRDQFENMNGRINTIQESLMNSISTVESIPSRQTIEMPAMIEDKSQTSGDLDQAMPDPQIDASDLVELKSLYEVMGVSRRKIKDRRVVGQMFRASIEEYADRKRVKPVRKENSYGAIGNFWPRDFFNEWLHEKGVDVLAGYLGKKNLQRQMRKNSITVA